MDPSTRPLTDARAVSTLVCCDSCSCERAEEAGSQLGLLICGFFYEFEHILLEGVPRLTRWVAGAQSWPRALGLQSCGASSAAALPSTLRTASRVLPAAPTPSNEEEQGPEEQRGSARGCRGKPGASRAGPTPVRGCPLSPALAPHSRLFRSPGPGAQGRRMWSCLGWLWTPSLSETPLSPTRVVSSLWGQD